MRKVYCLLASATLLCCQDISPAGKTKLAALLPGKAAAHFYLSDLYEYIDGGAEAYHQYGLAGMVHQEYRAGDTDVTADIYDMGDPLRAFGIYSAERSPKYHFIAMGAEGYSNEGLLNFLQGSYYVKLAGFSDSGKSAAVLDAAARAISARIGGGKTMPQALPWLPTKDLVEHSQKYILKEPLGHEYLSPAATAVYRRDGLETTLLVSMAADAVSHLKQTFQAAPLAGLPVEAWRGRNSYEGEVVFCASGRYTIVLLSPPPHPESFLKEILAAVR